MYLDTITDSKTELFKFYYRHGKDLRCPNIQGKSGSQHFVKLNIQKCPALLWYWGIDSFPACEDFCCLLISFADSLD